MGLLSMLKGRFFPPELCRAAQTNNEVAIADCLSRTSVTVIAADVGDAIALDAGQESVLQAVEVAAKKTSLTGDALKYELDGQTFLPVFTDASAADWFCGAYVNLLGHTHAFRLFAVSGTRLHHWLADGDTLVVNPQSDSERNIDPSLSRGLRRSLAESEDLGEVTYQSLTLPMAGISQPIELNPET